MTHEGFRIGANHYEQPDHLPGDELGDWVVMGKSVRSSPGRSIYVLAQCKDGKYIEQSVELRNLTQ